MSTTTKPEEYAERKAGPNASQQAAEPDDAETFRTIFATEWEEVRTRRLKHGLPGAAVVGAPPRNLSGLALSGGGIRSATFCLGLLQGLNLTQRLKDFDYLSTVSGGGYVGGWWSAWLARTKSPDSDVPDPRQRGCAGVFPPREELAPFAGVEEQTGGGVRTSKTPPSEVKATGAVLEYERTKREKAKSANISGESYADRASAGNDPIHHLRLFGNYLTPRKGAFSADTWRAITIISRNLLLTWLLLLPLLVVLILAAQLYFLAQPALDPPEPFYSAIWDGRGGIVLARLWLVIWAALGFCLWIAVLICAWMISSSEAETFRRMFAGWAGTFVVGVIFFALALGVYSLPSGQSTTPSPTRLGLFFWIAVGAFIVIRACYLPRDERVGETNGDGERGAAWAQVVGRRREVRRNRIARSHGAVLVTLTCVTLLLLFAGFGHELVNFLRSTEGPILKRVGKAGGWGAVLLSIGGSIYTAIKASPAGGRDPREISRPSVVGRLVITVTPPLVIVVLTLSISWIVNLFLAGTPSQEGGPSLTSLLNAVSCFGVALAIYFALAETLWKGTKAGADGGGRWLWREKPAEYWVLALFTLALSVIAFLQFWGIAQRFARWRWLHAVELSAWRDALGPIFLGAGLATCSLFLFLLLWRGRKKGNAKSFALLCGAFATLLLIGLLNDAGIEGLVGGPARVTLLQTVFGVGGVLLTWVLAFGWMADPNALSLHLFYKARLVRAYIGASNLRRGEVFKDISEGVEGDDVPLKLLKNCQRGAPYHLVNTTLNLVGARDLGTAQRSSDNFLMSKHYCGSSRTGYRRTAEYMKGRLSLGTAVAISGAAASPSMGSMTFSSSLVMLMTLLNVRLGYWAPTPNKDGWRETSARFWPYYTLRELLSQTNDLSTYCNLSDGGHFDNTGVYSLVARACRLIVVADCGADPRPAFSDLGTAIRRCRIDFNADIQLDLKELERDPPARSPAATFAVGKIIYDERHLEELLPPGVSGEERKHWLENKEGTIVVVKPALTMSRQEAVDVRQYGMQNEGFPQQSTADFWYDEAQFESYRRLGEHCAGFLPEGMKHKGTAGGGPISTQTI